MENINLPRITLIQDIPIQAELNQPNDYMTREGRKLKELELGIYDLIELSNVPDIVKVKGSKMPHSRYFVKLNARSFKPIQLLGILRAIIEHSNFEVIKNKNAGHITQEN